MVQNFPQSCQNWFLRVQKTILMKKKSFLKIDFFFEIWAKFFPTFGKKYSATLAEVLSKRSDEHFDVQQPLLKNIHLFRILVETFSEISNSCFAKLWKAFSKNWYEHFNQKNLFEKFSSFFGIGSKHFLTFGKNSTERLSELLSTCSKTSWRNRLFHLFSLSVV